MAGPLTDVRGLHEEATGCQEAAGERGELGVENLDRACMRTLLASHMDAVQAGVWSDDAAFSVAASLNSHAVA